MAGICPSDASGSSILALISILIRCHEALSLVPRFVGVEETENGDALVKGKS